MIATRSRTLNYDNWRIAHDDPLALLSVDSPIVNSIRWYRTKRDLPFLVLRRYANEHDDNGNRAIDECPIYRLNGSKVTDILEYDIVQCARALFRDIEKIMVEHSGKPRFGVFRDMNCKREKSVDIIDGGLFAAWSAWDNYSMRVAVECNVLVR